MLHSDYLSPGVVLYDNGRAIAVGAGRRASGRGGLGDAATDAYQALVLEELRRRSLAWPLCAAPDCSPGGRGNILTMGYAPLGVVPVSFGFFFPMSEFTTMGPKSRTVADADLVPGALRKMEGVWSDMSIARWKHVKQYGHGTGLDMSIPYLSLDAFVKKFPEFVVGSYLGYSPGPAPTSDERTKKDGVRKYAARGGWLVWKDVFDGKVPVSTTIPTVCLDGCRACKTSSWPDGAPQCKQSLTLETDNFTWGVFVKREPNARVTLRIERLPKNGWDKLEDGVTTLLDGIRSLLKKICSNQGLVAAGAGAAGGAGGAGAAQLAMARYCGVSAPAPATTTPTPPRTPSAPSRPPATTAVKPWYARGSTYAVAGGAVAAIGIAAMFARR